MICIITDIVAFALQIVEARDSGPQGVFELRLRKFYNYHASDINGNCCEGLKSNGLCSGRCNTKFRLEMSVQNRTKSLNNRKIIVISCH